MNNISGIRQSVESFAKALSECERSGAADAENIGQIASEVFSDAENLNRDNLFEACNSAVGHASEAITQLARKGLRPGWPQRLRQPL